MLPELRARVRLLGSCRSRPGQSWPGGGAHSLGPIPRSTSLCVTSPAPGPAHGTAVISSPDLGVFAVTAAGVLCAFCCVLDALSEHCLRASVSQLCGCCVPGCEHLLGLFGGGVRGGTRGNSGGDHGAAQLGEHVFEGGLGLGVIPGLVVA